MHLAYVILGGIDGAKKMIKWPISTRITTSDSRYDESVCDPRRAH